MKWTVSEVEALAPDEASVKAARSLATPGKWPTLGHNEAAAWGECQGSGAKPYQTQVDFSEPAFRCSCPSRKFPCKHGLGLLLMRANTPEAFKTQSSPAWVEEWLSSRASKAQKKEEREKEKAAAPVDAPAAAPAAAKSQAQRWQRIEAAAGELQTWLADQITQGLAAAQGQALVAWQTMAARMVDAQAPGLAARIREAADLLRDQRDRPELALEQLGLLQLICDALAGRAGLHEDLQAELRQAVGWPMDKEDVLAQMQPVQDDWLVLGQITEDKEAKLVERRVWLQGVSSGQRAWLLEHAYGGKGFSMLWRTGSSVRTSLVFYPGAAKLRALCTEAGSAQAAAGLPSTTMAQEWQHIAQRVAASPWSNLHPLLLPGALVFKQNNQAAVQCEGQILPLYLPADELWALLAVSGGQPINIMAEWTGHQLQPLSAWQPAEQGHSAPALMWQRN
jgi:hypothetical protein